MGPGLEAHPPMLVLRSVHPIDVAAIFWRCYWELSAKGRVSSGKVKGEG